MFVKNFLTSGEFLTVVPAGLRTTLQYDDNGRIEKVFKGWQVKVDITDKMLKRILSEKLVPNTISVTKGTTWVYGVMYTPTRYSVSGLLPDCIEDEILEDFSSGVGRFNFFAGDIQSFATTFKGSVAIRQWLELSQFHVLPGIVIPAKLNEQLFEKLVNTSRFTFTYPIISDYMIFGNHPTYYESTDIYQGVVDSVIIDITDSGKLVGVLTLKQDKNGESVKLYIDYSDVYRFNIQPKDIITYDNVHKILHNHVADKSRSPVKSTISCPVCGKLIQLESQREVYCTDDNCNSRLYPRVNRFLKTVKLPSMSHDEYVKMTTKIGNIFAVPDVLDYDKYSELTVEVPLPKVLQAIIPPDVYRGYDNFSILCNRCNNSIDTIAYYINHPDKLASDLKLERYAGIGNLVKWLSDPANAADVCSVLYDSHIKITQTDRKFDGPPIFRGRTIRLTGRFVHGSSAEVSSILQSYAATVLIDDSSDKIDCVLVGDIGEDIDGRVIKNARASGVPIFEESKFFARYGIDDDIHQNL